MSQTFDTAIGESYLVMFSLQTYSAVTTPFTVDVTMGGATFHAVIPTGPCCTWYDYSTILPASSNSSTIVFSSIDPQNTGPFIDDVKVIAASPPDSAPAIYAQPQSQTNAVGDTVTFTVAATGPAPLAYQWLSNSLPLADGGRLTGVHSNQFTIASLQESDAGNYLVVVSNDFGFVVSSNALLVVTTNLTWTGAISSDWNNPANWTPPVVPGVGSHVAINSGSVTIPANATFGQMDWAGGTISGALTIASNGVLSVSGSGDKFLRGPLTNAGTVVWSGTGGWYLWSNVAIYNLADGLFDIKNDASLANTPLDPYPSTTCCGLFSNAGTVRKSAGSGASDIRVIFNNSGTVDAQSGTVRFSGDYSNTPAANLTVALGGAAPGSGYSQIQFAQPPTFDGTFTVSTRNSYRPNPGDTFQVLSYPSATNTFLCMSGLDVGGGVLLQPQFSPTRLTLTAAAYTPGSEPQLLISRWPGGLLVQWPLGFHDWDLQSTTNLASLAWTPVPTQCDNQALIPSVLPKQYFRLAKRTQPVIQDPVGNLTGDTNRTFMDIVATSIRTEGTNYSFEVQMATPFPSAAQMAGNKRFDVIWFVDIDRNRATGQDASGNDYNIHLWLDVTGWHYYWFKVSSVSQADGIVNSASAYRITVAGDRATLTFPQAYLPSRSFEMWARCFNPNPENWPPFTQNPYTARATFNF